MAENKLSEDKLSKRQTLSKEELSALLEPEALSISNFRAAISGKTWLFKAGLFAITLATTTYLALYSADVLDRFLSFGWTQHYGDYRLHQIRFFIGFLMMVVLYICILLRRPLNALLLSYAGLLSYFLISGTSRLMVVLDEPNGLRFVIGYFTLHSAFVLLLLLMAREERRSTW